MRLVNHEFENKVSEDLFRTVVVPFRPEIYGIAEEPGRDSPGEQRCDDKPNTSLQPNAAVMLQDKGMRVFQGFGRHIHKFAMSFELDYDTLVEPPAKTDQEAITTFWGIYRWPFKKYNRFSQLEGLEQTADETMTMTNALSYICNAKELGLSIDGGLGWLAGPDINMKATGAGNKKPVFGKSKFLADEASSGAELSPSLAIESMHQLLSRSSSNLDISVTVASDVNTRSISAMEQMLMEAGYDGPHLSQSVQTLLESEGVPQSFVLRDRLGLMTRSTLERFLKQGSQGVPSTDKGGSDDAGAAKQYFLKPNDLTNSQKEILLETEWAQRAFMQSYAIAIIDNPVTFQHVTSLTIARLPSCHVTILRRSDFWTSLSQLAEISLSIIPDWREVSKLPTSWVEDHRVAPSRSIQGVFHLLRDQIAPQKSIKSLHFEWLCGGEYASGIFSRNQHILAAPVLPEAIDMLKSLQDKSSLLRLPFIENLSLKNCWLSPHVLLCFINQLKKQTLRTVLFDSISLSAPLTRDAQPGHLNPMHQLNFAPQMNIQANNNGMLIGGVVLPATGPGNLMQINAPNPGQANVLLQSHMDPLAWLATPRYGSWTYIIDRISPGVTLANLRYLREIGPEPPHSDVHHLKSLIFKSCGYIRLPLALDQGMLDPPEAPTVDSAIAKRRTELEGLMLKPLEHTLGTIINHMDEAEVLTLQNAWNLITGGQDADELSVQAQADGVNRAGHGRFRGIIDASTPS